LSALKICPQCGREYEMDQRFCANDGSTLRAQNSAGDLVGETIADRYYVLKKLGEGGMGQVYLAEHVRMGRKSAVKVMNPGMVNDADAISRFNREASNASRINHPNVAAIYDFGETKDGLIYLAMEYVEGDALTKIVEQQGALPAARAADITKQAADALNVAHDMGIVHRDLKPDNIMIARNRDSSDCVKVVDFGIAKAGNAENQKVTRTGLVVGTPEYMSPEQLAGDKLDGRSDIYSLALVAFNMLTGRLPFPSETVQESMIMRLTDRPRTLAEMKGDVPWPPELQAVMDRALARDSGSRYQSAAEFGRDMVRAVERMPASASAAELGTMVMGAAAVPPTRIASASPAPAAARTAAMAAPQLQNTVHSAPAYTPPARSRTPLMVGGGLGAVAAAGALVFALTRPKTVEAPTTRSDSSASIAALEPTTPTDAATSANPGSTAAPLPVRGGGTTGSPGTGTRTATESPRPNSGMSAVTPGTSNRPAPAGPVPVPFAVPQVDYSADISEMARVSSKSDGPTEADARRTVQLGQRILNGQPTKDELAKAQYYVGAAHIQLGDEVAGCRLMRSAVENGRRARESQIVEAAQAIADRCP